MDEEALRFRRGRGDWAGWSDIGEVLEAAANWEKSFEGIERPWLCWNVNDDWCFLQQRLVVSVGWTPVVGFDPRYGPPEKLVPGAVVVDFNARLRLPMMSMLFPLEFVFLFCEKLAFWHSDLLVPEKDMVRVARTFNSLRQGATAAVRPMSWRIMLSPKKWRYWELIGCTTRDASRDQFEKGCGWWRNFWYHKNRREDPRNPKWRKYSWDHGVGIMYWKRKYGGKMIGLNERTFSKGHFSRTRKSDYIVVSPNNVFRDLRQDLVRNFDLEVCARELGLESYLETNR